MYNNERLLKALFEVAFSPSKAIDNINDDERFQLLAERLGSEFTDERFLELFEYAVNRSAYGETEPGTTLPLTYGKVMYVFKEYLTEDQDVEIVKVKHGYAVFVWNEQRKEYIISEGFTTPDELAHFLANSYAVFHELQVNDNGKRDLSPEEKAEIDNASKALLDRCYQY